MKIILIDDDTETVLEPTTETERQQMSKVIDLLKAIFTKKKTSKNKKSG